ncbi:hypothetical protein BC834DRAFT_975087 [Gloeopeniophorella convolvens]|nr:hypothetical protein BC834DRAFT_975087 [Gloeopeniophorella convolvens]
MFTFKRFVVAVTLLLVAVANVEAGLAVRHEPGSDTAPGTDAAPGTEGGTDGALCCWRISEDWLNLNN